MAVPHDADARHRTHDSARQRSAGRSLILPGVEVMREGRVEPFLPVHPTLSSAEVRWSGLALEDYSVPALVIPQHEHVEHFVHVVLRGSVKYEVTTRGKTLRFGASPGTTFILPRGTVDEVIWRGPTHRIALLGTFRVSTLEAVLAATALFLAPAYLLYLYRRVIFGTITRADLRNILDLDLREKAVFAPLLLVTLWMGIYQTSFVRPIQASANHIIEQVTAALGSAGPRQARLR